VQKIFIDLLLGEEKKMCYNVESHIYTYLQSEKLSLAASRYNKEKEAIRRDSRMGERSIYH
jgi:hypothetical protein